jgi:hypothetical protein
MLRDAELLTVKVAGAETAGLYDLDPFDKDPNDDIPFRGFEEDTDD